LAVLIHQAITPWGGVLTTTVLPQFGRGLGQD
jgi:hypothetical protein